MRYLSATCLATSLLLAAAPASAAPRKSTETALAARAAQVVASAPNVRLAAYIVSGVSSGFNCVATVVRGKGVKSATSTGFPCNEICIKPSVALNLNTIVPVVSAEFTGSRLDVNIAQWRTSAVGCPAGTIEVVVYSSSLNSSGGFGATSPVAISIIVP